MIKYYNGEMYRIPQAFEDEVRADERAKVIEQLLADLNPCVFCHNSTDCDKDYFFENCANEERISWNDLRLRVEQIKGAEE